jgi:hypothetical protein
VNDGFVNQVHQPVVFTSFSDRIDDTAIPKVGIVQTIISA